MLISQHLSQQGLLVRAMLILALTALALAGCDESVNPFVESDRIYSVYGSLDMNADTQYVRVIPIDTSLIVQGAGSHRRHSVIH